MWKWLSYIDKVHRKSEVYVVYLSGLFVIAIMALTSLEVVLRKFVNTSIPGLIEITSQLMVGISLLGISYVQQKKEHISVDMISKRVSLSFIQFSDLLVFSLGLLISIVFSWQGYISLYNSLLYQENTFGLISVPLWPGKLIVAVSMTLIAFRFLLDILHQFIKTTGNHI